MVQIKVSAVLNACSRCGIVASSLPSLGEEGACVCASHAFVCLFERVCFCPFSHILGIGDWLRFLIVALPGPFY